MMARQLYNAQLCALVCRSPSVLTLSCVVEDGVRSQLLVCMRKMRGHAFPSQSPSVSCAADADLKEEGREKDEEQQQQQYEEEADVDEVYSGSP